MEEENPSFSLTGNLEFLEPQVKEEAKLNYVRW